MSVSKLKQQAGGKNDAQFAAANRNHIASIE